MIEIRKYMSNCRFLEDVSFFLLKQLINAFFPFSLVLSADMFGHKKDLIGYLPLLF